MTELNIIFKALSFAALKHRDQRRKNVEASPYINHPIDLVNVLVNEGQVNDTDVIVAAILHDTVEDTDTTLAELEHEFSKEIATIVSEVTDDTSLESSKRKQQQIDRAANASYQAHLVKLADKICNLRDMNTSPPASWNLQRRREYFQWSIEVINQIRGTHARLERIFDEVSSETP